MDVKDYVALLTSTESNNTGSGTGFAVTHSEGKLFILTCAHVIKELNSKVKVEFLNSEEARQATVEVIGTDTDIALLSTHWEDMPPFLFNKIAKGKQSMEVQVVGHSPSRTEGNELRYLKDKLGTDTARKIKGCVKMVGYPYCRRINMF